jgi:hypothetical protein
MADTDAGNPTEIVRAQGAAAKLLERMLELVTEPVYAVVPDKAFIEVFPPETLARSLADHPEERADMLDAVMKTEGKIFRTTWKSLRPETVEDLLENMLRAQETTAEIVRLSLSPERWTAVLDAQSLLRLCEYGRWWKRAWPSCDRPENRQIVGNVPQAQCLITLLKLFDELEFITPAEKLDRIGIARLVQDLSEQSARGLCTAILNINHVEGKAFGAKDVFEMIGNAELAERIDPGYLYQAAREPVLRRLGLVPKAEEPEPAANATDDPQLSAEIDDAFTRFSPVGEEDIQVDENPESDSSSAAQGQE